MKKEMKYSSPVAEFCEFREDALLCYSPEGQNENYTIDDFTW